MTPREKILRGGLMETKLDIAAILRSRDRASRMGEIASDALEQILFALKQADAIKDGPSEEDKRRYERFKSILLDQKDRLTWREAKELFRLVSRSWGIE